MTREQKCEWCKNADSEALLHQYVTFINSNQYGRYEEDIEIVKAEIMRRMAGVEDRSE